MTAAIPAPVAPPPAASARREALAAAQALRLPFASRSWHGPQGGWLGQGLGSSIDFQDHRAYQMGDDPRHIHWAAFARTGQLTMKQFRAEVAPFVEIAVDVSPSMTFDPAKAARTDALLAFCVESADRTGAPLRIHAAHGRNVRAVAADEVRAGRWRERLGNLAEILPPSTGKKRSAREQPPEPPGPLPWRGGALRVLISDLLFPGDPSSVLVPLAAGGGTAVVLAPALAAEGDAPPDGNIDLIDCERPAQHRKQRVDAAVAARYRAAYARHFTLWREAAKRRGVRLAVVACARDLAAALMAEALPAGAVELNT
jgi:uncharacterized protein (DUF58 family)